MNQHLFETLQDVCDFTALEGDMNEIKIAVARDKATCGTCKHIEPWRCNSKVFQYCGIRKSRRTENGLLKIKCKMVACTFYQGREMKQRTHTDQNQKKVGKTDNLMNNL